MSLEARSAGFGYRGRRVLSEVSFSVYPGEIVALLGPNGCGKTTMFRTLLGSLPLKDGHVALEGDDLSALSQSTRARALAYVPQVHAPPFPYLALDVVALGRLPHLGTFGAIGVDDRARALAALERMDAAHLADRPVTELSGGERQRVLFARAIAQESRYLLLDEPTSHLDFGHVHQALGIIRSLAKEGRGILWTTHDPEQAMRLADRVVVLHGGTVEACGPPSRVLVPELFEKVFGIRARVDVWTDSDNMVCHRCRVEECS